jgi:TolB-like protein
VIEERVRTAKAVVVLWSQAAAESQWVRSEASLANEQSKLVQLRLDEARLPMPFEQVQCADLSHWSGDSRNPEWRKVVASVADLIGPSESCAPEVRPAIARPGMPSIAVLPFRALGGAKGSEYLAEAVSEEIVTALSRQHLFFVISSGSSFTYRDRQADVGRVSRELGVRYVLEGSAVRLGQRVRVTARLADADDASTLWAEQFDRELVDILALQDEVAERVVAAIEPAMLHREGSRAARGALADFSALDCFYRGMWQLNRVSEEGYKEALALFREAVRGDPELSLGHIGLSRILFGGAIFGWTDRGEEDLREARDAYAYFARSGASLYLGDHGAAVGDAETAISLNANCAPAHIRMGQTLTFAGRPADAIAPLQRGLRLSPYDSQLGVMSDSLALAHYHARQYEEAAATARAALNHTHAAGSTVLAASLAQLGRLAEARAMLPAPGWRSGSPQRPMAAPYADPADREHLREGVRLARGG